MLFSSYFFLILFLPIALAGFGILSRLSVGRACIAWIVLCSAVFYGWKSPPHLLLLFGSILANFGLGQWIDRLREQTMFRRKLRWIVGGGVAGNLALIGVFKYTPFFLETVSFLGLPTAAVQVVLPIGISFFTFQQIAYLVDVYRNGKSCRNLVDYAFFVSFFPQLIAGPIVHHRQILPQLQSDRRRRLRSRSLSIGVTLLTIGLFKKVVLADQFAIFASPVFEAAERGHTPTLMEAWVGAIGYSLQIYFDFSGYSDMALGLGRLFGFRLPINFLSPYQATSIIDFWRRWHMTLSRFLRDYVYFALGGNRRGVGRRYVNLMATMLIGGLWHGASWTFVVWGGFHGMLLCINHGIRFVLTKLGVPSDQLGQRTPWKVAGIGATFLAVTFGWVVFRSESFAGALTIIQAMIGFNGLSLEYPGIDRKLIVFWLALGLAIVWFCPNSIWLMRKCRVASGNARQAVDPLLTANRRRRFSFAWHANWLWACLIAGMLLVSFIMLDRPSEFIYYQF